MTSEPADVLVVDDDADTRANLRDILELDGYRVDVAGSIAAVLQRTDWSRLIAVILDRRLPDGTAEGLLPRLRELAPNVAIIIVTGYADLEGAITALRHGATDYILKPADAATLRRRLRTIVEHRETQTQLAEAQRRLLQSERLAAIGKAMTGLVHESRNALQRSQACLEMLARRVADRPEAMDLIARIQVAQDDLHRLYEEVRSYAAPIALERQPCSISETLREAWENLAAQRDGRSTRLRETLRSPDGVPIESPPSCSSATPSVRCRCDRFALRQVLRNVLENSLAACGDHAQIDVAYAPCEVDGEPAWEITLRDDGPGFTPEQSQRIFEEFYTTKTHGTGLGMAICKRLVEAHGGRIAAGPPGRTGAEIRITFPGRIP